MRIRALDVPDFELPPNPPGWLPGWLKTPENTGLSSVGVTHDMLETAVVNEFGGNRAYPTVSGVQYRKKFTREVGAAAGTKFIECLFQGNGGALITPLGDGVEVLDSDTTMIANQAISQTHINVNPYFTGSGNTMTIVRNVTMRGGSIFINATDAGAMIEDVYAYDQIPEVGAGQHRDGFTSRGRRPNGPPIVVRRSAFITDQDSTTAPFFLQDTYGSGVHGVQILDSYLGGSGYMMVMDRVHDTVVVNVRTDPFGPHSYWHFTLGNMGPSTFARWEDVYAYDPENAANDYKGEAVPMPVYSL